MTNAKSWISCRSRSFKVIDFGINRKPVCDLLLVVNTNWLPISYHFGVIAAYRSNFGHFLANVNVMSSCIRLSSVCLSVTFVHPTQAIEIFDNVSTPFNTLAIWRHPGKILRRSSQGKPSVGGLNQKRVQQDAQLSQRDRAAGCVIVFAKSRRLELGDNILQTL